MTLKKFKEIFDPLFIKKVESLVNRASKVSKSEEFNKIISHIKNLAENGKRVRPYIINLAYNHKKFNKEITNQMVGIELLHLFALIHDDIMDGSPKRHGVRTINTMHKNDNLAKSYAMLAGDLVFNWAYEVFLEKNKNEKSIKIFQSLIEEVIVGQAIDAGLPHQKNVTKEDLDEKNILKTARYTFRRPIEIGLSLKKEKVSTGGQKFFSQIGENIGIIFQIDDDLLDIFGDEKKLQKKTFSDMESGQTTIISFYLGKNKIFKSFFGKNLNKEEREKLKKLIIDSGTKEKIEKEKEELVDKTKKLIEKLNEKDVWLEFLNKIINREK